MLPTIPEEHQEPGNPTAGKSLNKLVRENATLRSKICKLLSTSSGGDASHQQCKMIKTPRPKRAAVESRGSEQGKVPDEAGLFVSWQSLMEKEVVVFEPEEEKGSGRSPKHCSKECHRGLIRGTIFQSSDGEDSADNDNEEGAAFNMKVGGGSMKIDASAFAYGSEGSTAASSGDDSKEIAASSFGSETSNSPEASGSPYSSDGDSQEVHGIGFGSKEDSGRGRSGNAGSPKEASRVGPSILRSKRSSSPNKRVSWGGVQTGNRHCSGSFDRSKPLAAGLEPVAPQLPVQTALLAGLILTGAGSETSPRATGRNRSPSPRRRGGSGGPGAGAGSLTLEPGNSVKVRGLPADDRVGTIIVVNHAEGSYKVRMSNGGVNWFDSDKVEPLPVQGSP